MSAVEGLVVRGDGRGRQLGYPTANLKLESGRAPEPGVYEVEVEGAANAPARAVCNVGTRPTIEGSCGLHVEVHIPRFSADLYGRRLKIRFIRRIRGEKKFPSLDALKAQIAADVASLG